MELPIKKLLEKYWNGETSVSEEQEIKDFFKKNPSLADEGLYFRGLSKQKEVYAGSLFQHPGKNAGKSNWYSAVAAALMLGIVVSSFFITQNQKPKQFVIDDPKEAYEVTRQALMMVSAGLNEGKTYTAEIEKFNKTKQIIKK
jgi:hypothetical protein